MNFSKFVKTPHGDGKAPDGSARTNIIQQNLKNFFSEVSVGGAKYTVLTSASFFRRLVWVILVLFGVGFCIFQIIDRVQYYTRWPTTANIRINHVRELRFPTVTICNENRIVKSKLLNALGPEVVEIVAGLAQPLEHFGPAPEVDFTQFDFEGMDWNLIYNGLVQTPDEAILYCLWDGQLCNHTEFQMINTNLGNCFQFNPASTERTSYRAGATNGLKLVLRVDQQEYILPAIGSLAAGFRLGLHMPDSQPMMKEWGFRVTPGQQTLVAVGQRRVVSPGMPYIDCSTEVDYKYTTCLSECEADYIINNCSCRDVQMKGEVPICGPQQLQTCLQPAMQTYIRTNVAAQCNCPYQCNNTDFMYTISSAAASDFFINYIRPFIGENVTAEYVKNEFAMVEIFYSQLAYEEIVTVPAYTVLALACDIGGAMGLILGSTVLTLFEVVDFILINMWNLCYVKHSKVTMVTEQ